MGIFDEYTMLNYLDIEADSSSTSIETEDLHNETIKNNILHNNYPNPFGPTTTIRFELIQPSHINLAIYDITGKLIKTLLNDKKECGSYSLTWDGKDEDNKSMPCGIYLYRLEGEDFIETRKIIFLK